MAKHAWTITLSGKQRSIILDHNYWSTRQVVTIDGKVIVDKTPLNNLQNDHYFELNEHLCCVMVGRRFLTTGIKYTLTVDGDIVPEK